VVLSQGTKALRDVARRQPFDFRRLFFQDYSENISRKLHGAIKINTARAKGVLRFNSCFELDVHPSSDTTTASRRL
jgi:hypothetical protein